MLARDPCACTGGGGFVASAALGCATGSALATGMLSADMPDIANTMMMRRVVQASHTSGRRAEDGTDGLLFQLGRLVKLCKELIAVARDNVPNVLGLDAVNGGWTKARMPKRSFCRHT